MEDEGSEAPRRWVQDIYDDGREEVGMGLPESRKPGVEDVLVRVCCVTDEASACPPRP